MLDNGPQKENWLVRKKMCYENQEETHQKSLIE